MSGRAAVMDGAAATGAPAGQGSASVSFTKPGAPAAPGR